MDISLHFTNAVSEGCTVLHKEKDSITIRQTSPQAWIHFPAPDPSAALQSAGLFTGIVTNDSNRCIHCHIQMSGEGRSFFYTVSLMPGLTVDLLFRMIHLNGECHYPPMEPGTLKSSIGGSILPEEIRRISIGFDGDGVCYTLRHLRFTDTEPVYCRADRVLCDALGQWTERDWPGKTTSAEELKDKLQQACFDSDAAVPDWQDAYGGDVRYPMTEPSDRFTVWKKDGKWWLVTPAGNAFFSTGVFGVYPGEYGWIRGNEGWIGPLPPEEGAFAPAWRFAEEEELYRRKFHGMFPPDTKLFSFATANLIRCFGEKWRENWTKITVSRLRKWSVNTLSMFSDPLFIRDSGMPYVFMLHQYPATERRIFREFPDVFDPAYTEASDRYAAQLAAHADNPRLIGYFMNNEPTFAWSDPWTLAEKLLEKDNSYVSRKYLIDFLREKYGGAVSALNTAWQTEFSDYTDLQKPIQRAAAFSEAAREDLCAFSAILMDRYVRIPAAACRKAAPKRLNLGMRFAGVSPLTIPTAKYFDVFSVNYYGMDPTNTLNAISAHADMPILIGEFHFGGYDAGLPAAGIIPLPTQRERAEAYRHYMQKAAVHPCAVGAHYFAYNDQPLWGRYDCENFQFGFVDVCQMPYPQFTETAAEINKQIVSLRQNGKEE